MPTFNDIRKFLAANAFGMPTLTTSRLDGKVIIVTGSNTGLGFEAALHLYVQAAT
jgi:hypothetical protein